jgi:methionyl-tRNA formyltransferase
VVLIGAVHEALPALEQLLTSPVADLVLVVTPADPPAAGPQVLSGRVDLAGPARAAGVPVLAVRDVNAPEVVQQIAARRPDLLVVSGWTRLLGAPLLAVPRRGCIGFHASLLPRNRGRAPVNWAILRGERLTGNTMMFLDEHVDTGDIVDQVPVPIGPLDTCATVYEGIGRAGAEMLARHLPALLAGTAPRRSQPAGAEVLPRRTPEMGVVDWTLPAPELHDWVRALTLPYPGAFTSVDGRRVMLWTVRVATAPTGAAPGTVVALREPGVQVATGAGDLVVTWAGDPGAPARRARAWFLDAGLDVGTRFDALPPDVSRWTRGLGPRPAEARA